MTQATDLSSVLAYDSFVLAILLVLAATFDRDRAVDRSIFGLGVAGLLISYVAWRLSTTLPEFGPSAHGVWAWTFAGLETMSIGYALLSILILSRSTNHTPAADLSEATLRKDRASGKTVPAVDVFICTYNEDLGILERTIQAALAIDYPNHTVWVLDDKRRGWLRDYCDDHGAKYITRTDNSGAKAGNLDNGLRITRELSNAPFILVLDADFAPQRPILLRTLGLFDDPRVAVVQTPQFYYNADPVQHNLLAEHAWVDDQRVFFDVFEPARDAWDTAFCVGTSFVVRRSALDLIGGFPKGTVTEDIHLSYKLMSHGLLTRWLNERLSVGLSAEGISEYVTQRTRWCLGTIQVALLADGPLQGAGYSFSQRLHYVHGLMHWTNSFFAVALVAAPIFYWVFNMPAIVTDHKSFLLHGLPALLGFWTYSYWRSNGRTLPLFTEVTQLVTAVPVAITIFAAIWRPFGQPFTVTPKGGDRSRVTVNWGLGGVFAGVLFVSALGMLLPQIDPFRSVALDPQRSFNALWGSVSLVFCFVALLICVELPRSKAGERFPVREKARIRHVGKVQSCMVLELSIHEAVLESSHEFVRDLTVGSSIEIELDEVGWIGGQPERHTSDGRLEVSISLDDGARARLIRRLFSNAPVNIAQRVAPHRAWMGLFSRAFKSPRSFRRE